MKRASPPVCWPACLTGSPWACVIASNEQADGLLWTCCLGSRSKSEMWKPNEELVIDIARELAPRGQQHRLRWMGGVRLVQRQHSFCSKTPTTSSMSSMLVHSPSALCYVTSVVQGHRSAVRPLPHAGP